jgi:WD40 repeat protein
VTAVDRTPAVAAIEPMTPALPAPARQLILPVAANPASPTVAETAAPVRPPRQAELYATAVSPDGQYRLEARTGLPVALVRPADNSRLAFATDPPVKCAAFSPDSRSFATGHDNSEVQLNDSLTGGQIKSLQGASAAITTVAFSPEGQRIAAGAADGSVTLWDVESGEARTLFGPRAAPVSCLRWSRDGNRLAISLGDLREPELATLLFCESDDGRVLAQHALAEPAGAIDWTAGDRAILVADWSGAAVVWRISDGLVLAQRPLDKRVVSAANWSPDCPLTIPQGVGQRLVRAVR